jgi:hypothetical protein
MDAILKQAILLGKHEALLEFAIKGLKGETYMQGKELAEYLEQRIEEMNLEINTNQYEHRNNVKGNTQSTESNTEAVAGEI